MPSFQVDLPLTLDIDAKRHLAQRLGATYASIMQINPDIITVSIHDLGAGSVWRCGADDPVPAALLMCDIRRGRPSQTRAELARSLVEVCATELGLDAHQMKVEFTQHTGDEMYHPHLGGFNHDWTGDERARNTDG